MDLAGYLALAVVAEEVLLQQFRQLQRLLVFLPAADLFEELRVDLLEGLRLLSESAA